MRGMKFNVITIFPDLISHYCAESILGRAQEATAAAGSRRGGKKIISVNAVNLRDFATDKHHKVDDTPYGGGAGMVMKPEPIYAALKNLGALKRKRPRKTARTILLSPRGRQFEQRTAEDWSKLKEITFVCGRYEGVDQRVSDCMVDEEISIGPYVLAGGEIGALVIIEAVSRLLPGVLGNPESLMEETFGTLAPEHPSKPACDSIQVEYPQYTKPVDFMGWKVPDILLSGDHKKIREWRKSERKEL